MLITTLEPFQNKWKFLIICNFQVLKLNLLFMLNKVTLNLSTFFFPPLKLQSRKKYIFLHSTSPNGYGHISCFQSIQYTIYCTMKQSSTKACSGFFTMAPNDSVSCSSFVSNIQVIQKNNSEVIEQEKSCNSITLTEHSLTKGYIYHLWLHIK